LLSESTAINPLLGIKKTGDMEDGQMPPCRVLVVEDDLDDQILAKKRLSASSMVESIVFFSDGTELIHYLYDQEFQDRSVWHMTPMVIVLDLNMPLMDGFEVLQKLKSDAVLADIPVLVLTGTQSKADVDRALRLKADAVFEKPLDLGKMESYFRQALN
jgi:CheY-like chemotaxis protein